MKSLNSILALVCGKFAATIDCIFCLTRSSCSGVSALISPIACALAAANAQAIGDIRALTPEQLERVKQKMQSIVAANLPQTKAKIEFKDFMPPMAPTPRNQTLFAQYAAQSEAAGLGAVLELDPMQRGAGDSAWISPYVATITGR